MNFYISDLHFGHRNVIEFDDRPFETVDIMDATLIQRWNQRVNPEDHIYVVGDLCYRNEKAEQWYLKQLNGHKHLILGNHDVRIQKNKEAMSYFDSIDQIKIIKDGENNVVLCHFPLASWPMEHHGAWHIYGHVHNNREDRDDAVSFMKSKARSLNAGCMLNEYAPATLAELIESQRRE